MKNMKYHPIFEEKHIDRIREGVFSILEEIGVKVGRSDCVEALAQKGFRTNGHFVYIDRETARKKMESQRGSGQPPEKRPLSTYTSAYSHTYENLDGSFEAITNESNVAMARFLANVGALWPNLGISPPGHPQDVPPDLQFFRQAVNGFIWCKDFWAMEPVSVKAAPYHFELCEMMGKPVEGLPIYVASPLNISGESFDISYANAKRLSSVWVNSMPSLGANTPLNLIGAYAQTVAETLGGAVIFEALTGVRTYYAANIFTFDFYDVSMPFGTPEKLLLEWMNMEVGARISGGTFNGPWSTDIHTNATRCGIQACVEKASLMTAGAMLGATSFGCSGTLGMDELFSPVQLLLDLETIDHVQHIVDGMPLTDFDGDLIEEVRAGLNNGYMMSDRTLDNMMDYVWRPRFFTRKSFGAYQDAPFPIEVEKAKALADDLMKRPALWKLDEAREKEAERIFATAMKACQ